MLFFNLDERSVIALNEMFEDTQCTLNNDTNIFVSFRDFTYGKDTAIIICHGTQNGTVILGTHQEYREYTSKELLQLLLPTLQRDKIKTLYIVCCYGGLLPEITIDGVTIKPIHNDITPVTLQWNNSKNSNGTYTAFLKCNSINI